MMAARFLEPDQWGPGYVYATRRIKASSLYQDAIAYETELAIDYPKLFSEVGRVDGERFNRAAAMWERAGFFGWADNYRAAVARCPAPIDTVVVDRYDADALSCEAFVIEWAATHLAACSGPMHAGREWRRINARRERLGRYTTVPAYGSPLYVSYFEPRARNAGRP